MFSSDIAQLRSGELDVSWLRPALLGLAARLYTRPALLVFLNPARLTPLLRRESARAWPAYDAHHNNFLPFATGRFQFLALLSLVRAGSALWRALYALSGRGAPRDVAAVALGDAVGDGIEIALLRWRYGGGTHRLLHAANAVTALYLLRALLLNKPHDQQFARLMTQFAIASVPPLWFFALTRMRGWLKWGSAASLVAILAFVLPQLLAFVQHRPDERLEASETERADRRLNRAIAAIAIGFFGLKLPVLARLVFAK